MKKTLTALLVSLPLLAETKVRNAITQGAPINALDKGADPNVADNTAAINLCLNAAVNGVCYVPGGTYFVCGVNMPTTGPVELRGAGPGQTTLKTKNSCNADAITQSNFGTLTGGASTAGVFHVAVRDLTVDGNKANNASGFGIRLFGRAFKIQNVIVQSAKNDCLWTEGNQAAFADPTADLEPRLDHITLMQCGGAGWTHKGPNDLVSTNIVSWGHGTWGFDWYKPFHFNNINTFLNTSGGCRVSSGSSANGSDAQCTNAAGWGLLIDTGAGVSTFAASTAGCNGCVGIEVKAANQSFHGVVANSTTGVKFNGGGGIFNLTMFSNTTWFDCTSENGQVRLDVYSNDASGTMKGTSCWVGTERLDLPNIAGNTTRTQIPGVLSGFFIAGWNPVFPGSNSTLMVPDLAQAMTADFRPRTLAFASLGTPTNGTITYCSDCTIANPCAGGGTGALAKRLNGVWVCN